MKTTIIQFDITWASPSENIRKAEQLLAENSGSDLYVLPEMWATGFATEPDGIAEDEETSLALAWMRDASERYNCAVCGSLAIRTSEGSYVNRMYFVDGRSRKVSYYDKHHLFSYGHEDRHYTAGNSHTIVEYCGLRLLLLVCYDLRFPVWSRYGNGGEYDAIILVANWPVARQRAWQILTRARAIENQCYMICVNRVGCDSYCRYAGGSAIIEPLGKTICRCKSDTVYVATADIDIYYLQSRRSRFRVLDDRD